MATPHVLDQLITAVYQLCEDGEPKVISKAIARMHPEDMHRLEQRINLLTHQVMVLWTATSAGNSLTFLLDHIMWVCVWDEKVPLGSPLIIFETEQ